MKRIRISSGHYAIVDDIDYPLVSKYTWTLSKSGNRLYAITTKRRTPIKYSKRDTIYLHRLIMNVSGWHNCVDHINGDGLDCRRSNIRLCTRGQNAMNLKIRVDNSSGYKGVYFNQQRKKYAAQIQIDKKTKFLGLFHTKEEAAEKYNEYALMYYGEFSSINKLNICK